MNWLDELDAAAAEAIAGDWRMVEVRPERIRALIACVRAADAMRLSTVAGDISDDMAATDRAYDAARAALEATP